MDLTAILLICIPLFATLVVVTDDFAMQRVMKKQ